jgi:hypothetical protein
MELWWTKSEEPGVKEDEHDQNHDDGDHGFQSTLMLSEFLT